MKRNLNKGLFLEFIKSITGADLFYENQFCKNGYIFQKDNEDRFQIEFISATQKYFYTIYFRAISGNTPADYFIEHISKHITDLKLERNLIIDTESFAKLV